LLLNEELLEHVFIGLEHSKTAEINQMLSAEKLSGSSCRAAGRPVLPV